MKQKVNSVPIMTDQWTNFFTTSCEKPHKNQSMRNYCENHRIFFRIFNIGFSDKYSLKLILNKTEENVFFLTKSFLPLNLFIRGRGGGGALVHEITCYNIQTPSRVSENITQNSRRVSLSIGNCSLDFNTFHTSACLLRSV